MPTNPYFKSNFSKALTPEQQLMEDLILESIQIYGADVYYLPRNPLSQEDNIYGEQPGSLFNSAYPIEVYLASVSGYEGQSEFFSKFGLEVRDPMRVVMARRTFQRLVDTSSRPNEGDLLYIPQFGNLWEIRFVEEEKDFYSLGRRPPNFYYFELQLEVFKFNNERFNTGIPEIDQLGHDYSYTIQLTMDLPGIGNYIKGEPVYQGDSLATATASAFIKNWSHITGLMDIVTIKGEFTPGVQVIGDNSGASYSVTTYDRRDFSQQLEEYVNNKDIKDESVDIINYTADNPFGEPN